MELVGLSQIPRSAGARIACELIPEFAGPGNQVQEIAARRNQDHVVERPGLRAIPQQTR